MANDVSGNPLVLDTASTSAVVDPRNLHIKGVRLVGGSTAILQNKNGRVLYSFVSDGESDQEVRADGLIMHTLAGGTLYVYLRVVN